MTATTSMAVRDSAVNVASIERELQALWRQASQDKQVTRACSWNLVVLTHDDDLFTHMRPVLDEVVRHVPSRTLVLKSRPFDKGPEIEAFVSANCQIAPGGGKLLCTEEITIEARGADGNAHMPGLIRALNVPDVPTAMWWTGAPPTEASAVRLLTVGMDRLLFDSGAFVGDDARYAGLKKLAHVGGMLEGVVLCDLAWLRTSSLRSAIASIFDVAGAAPLYNLHRVRIAVAPHGIASAKLLIGWLASRLGFGAPERLDRGALSWSLMVRGGKDVRIDIEVEDDAAKDQTAEQRTAGVVGVLFETREGSSIRLTHDVDDVFVVDVQGGLSAPKIVHAHEPTAAQLVIAGLGSRGRDKLYTQALVRASELDRISSA